MLMQSASLFERDQSPQGATEHFVFHFVTHSFANMTEEWLTWE